VTHILDQARVQVLNGGAGLDADLKMLSRLRMPVKALSGTL
jgi:hypothetical protein